MMTRRWIGLCAGAVLCAAGCQTQADYQYRGRLLLSNGAPAADVQVAVTPPSSFIEDSAAPADTVTTDAHGYFQGGFANDMDGQGLQYRMTEMPPLAGVCLWVRTEDQWRKVPVSLYTIAERQRCSGGERIALPTVTLPGGPSTLPVNHLGTMPTVTTTFTLPNGAQTAPSPG